MHEWIVVTGALFGYFVFSAAVGAMIEPTLEQQTRFYGWLYRFLQRLAANADRLAQARYGGVAGPGTFAGAAGAVVASEHVERSTVATVVRQVGAGE